MFYRGEAGPVDLPAARKSWWTACYSGDGKVCLVYGEMVSKGIGGAVNEDEALQAYEAGCEAQEGASCYQAGLMHLNGRSGSYVNLPKARQAFGHACQLGFTEGCNRLGAMFKEGKGGTVDLPAARNMFRRACDGGVADACEALKAL